jgi:hypothetical protein
MVDGGEMVLVLGLCQDAYGITCLVIFNGAERPRPSPVGEDARETSRLIPDDGGLHIVG